MPASPPGRGQRLPSWAHHGSDLEIAGSEKVDTDETQIPGAGPTGLPGQLCGELHGMPDRGLHRAKDRLSLVSEASRPAPTPSLAPTPREALPAYPGVSFPSSGPPPTEPYSLVAPPPTRLEIQAFSLAAPALNLGYLRHPTQPQGYGVSAPSTQAFSRNHTRLFKGAQIPWPLPLPPPPPLHGPAKTRRECSFLSFT